MNKVEIDVEHLSRKIREVVADEPKAFAYDLGLSLSAVYNYMSGRIPTTDVLFRIAKHTRHPMEWFLDPEHDADMGAFVRGASGVSGPPSEDWPAQRAREEHARGSGTGLLRVDEPVWRDNREGDRPRSWSRLSE